MSKNKNLKNKTGIYIGSALCDNPDQPVEKLSFKDCDLRDEGLIRVLEACNSNTHIEKASLGYISNKGLKIMFEVL